jgi:acyl-coenzyme A thioesterase PaaI-like protein
MTERPGIVDGHGPDEHYPPGPEHRRLADAMRRVTDLLVRPGAPPDVVAAAAEQVEAAAEVLEPVTKAWSTFVPTMPDFSQSPNQYFPFSPMIGLYSPLAPPMHCEIREGEAHAHVTVPAAYEGPPGCVHGGIVAGLFDELLGVANIASGVGAMTGTLTIVYRSPTPLLQELTLHGKTTNIDGRKVYAKGTLHAGDRLCAEADGVFIMVAHERFVEHAQQHGAQNA